MKKECCHCWKTIWPGQKYLEVRTETHEDGEEVCGKQFVHFNCVALDGIPNGE